MRRRHRSRCSEPLPGAYFPAALRDAGHWGEIVDRDWRWVCMTDDLRLSCGGLLQLVPVPLGAHYFGTEAVSARLKWPTGANRVELACASGGRALASKALVERLDPDDAAALDLDPDRVSYTALADLPTATEKARRDAPAIAVCEV